MIKLKTNSKTIIRKSSVLVLTLLFAWSQVAFALPQGYSVQEGNATFDLSDPNSLIITASDNTIINFDSFSIGENESVRFIQPSELASILGRVNGSSSSDIYGSLFANGQLFLINPNGFYFGATANVQAQGFTASTLNIQDALYLQNQFVFEKQEGYDPARIINEGAIIANSGGFVALLANEIQNKGTIQANLGSVALGAGDRQILSFDDNGMINLMIDKGMAEKLNADRPAIDNSGLIRADGGRIIMTAKTLNETLNTIVNNTGIIEAQRAVEHDGVIEFVASGDIVNTGSIHADTGHVSMSAEGDIISTGSLKAGYLYERGETFKVGGLYQVVASSIDNDDLAITLGTGNYSGTTSDNVNVIVDDNAVITLTGATIFEADADADASGAFTMNAGSSIAGGGYGLTIRTGGAGTLRTIENVSSLTLERKGSATPTYTSSGTSPLATTAGGSLTIAANTTLNMSGNSLTVGTGGLTQNGNLSGTGAWDINGSWSVGNTAATNLAQSGTVNFSGSTLDFTNLDTYALGNSTFTVDGTSSITTGIVDDEDSIFYNFNVVTGADVTIVDRLDLSNDFTMSGGTFNAGTGQMGVVGDFEQSGGTFTSTSDSLIVVRDFTLSGGTFNHNNGVLMMANFFGQDQNITTNGRTLNTLYMWDIAGGDTNKVVINDNLTLAGGILNLNMDLDLDQFDVDISTVGGIAIDGGASFTKGSGTVTFNPGAGNTAMLVGNSQNFGNVRVQSGTLYANDTDYGNGYGLTEAAATFTTLTIDSGTAYQMNGGGANLTFTTLSNEGTLKLTGSETVTGSMDTNSGTVEYTGSGTYNSLAAGYNYNNLKISGSGSFTAASNTDINGAFTQTAGTFVAPGTMNIAGDFTKSGGTFTAGSNTVIFDGTSSLTSGGATFNNITVGTDSASGAVTLADNLDINGTLAFNTTGGSTSFVSSNRTVNYAGSTLNLTNADTFTTTGATWIFDGTTSLTSASKSLNNVTIGTDSSGGSLTLADTADINGLLSFNTTGGTSTFNMSSRTLNYSGATLNFTNLDTFTTNGSSTLIFDGTTSWTTAGKAIGSAVQIGSASAGGSLTLADNADFNNSLTINNGGATAFDISNRTVNFGGIFFTLTNLDTFTATGSTVVFDGALTGLTSSGFSFNNVTIGSNSANGYLVTGDDLDVNGTLAFNTTGGTSTFSMGSGYSFNYAGSALDFTNLDTLTIDATNTFIFDGDTTLTSAGKSLTNVTIGTNSSSGSLTIADSADINGTLAFNTTGGTSSLAVSSAGSIAYSGSTLNLTNLDNFSSEASRVFTFDGTTTLTSGGKSFAMDAEIGSTTAGGSLTLADDITFDRSISVKNGGSTTFTMTNRNVSISQNVDLTNLDTFNKSGSTFTVIGDLAIDSAGLALNNVTIGSNTAGGNLTFWEDTDMDGTLAFNTTGGTAVFNQYGSLNYSGSTLNFTNLDTFNYNSFSTLVFDGTTTLTSAGKSLRNVTIGTASSSGSLTLADAADVNGTLSFNTTGGTTTLDLNGQNLNYSGSALNISTLDNSGSAGSGTLVIDGTTSMTSAGSAQTFNPNLKVTTGGALSLTNYLHIGGDYTQDAGTFTGPSNSEDFDIEGDFNLTGGVFSTGWMRVKGDMTAAEAATYSQSSYLELNTSTSQTLTTNGHNLQGLIVSGTEVNVQGDLDIDTDLIVMGELNLDTYDADVTVGRHLQMAQVLFGSVPLDPSVTFGGGSITMNGSYDAILSLGGETLANLTIDGTSKNVTIADYDWLDIGALTSTGNGTITNLTIGSDDTLNLAGENLAVSTLSNNGTMKLQGGETVSVATMDTNSGTIEYTGSGTYNSLALGSNYYNLKISGSGSFTAASNTDMNGSFTQTAGTFVAPSQINVAGNYAHTGGTFNANSGTVVLDGTNQQISGSTTFNNLTKTVSSADTLTFAAGSTQTIGGTLTLRGAADNLLSLRSGSSGSAWNINAGTDPSVQYLNVQDSVSTQDVSCLIGCVDGARNVRWTFSIPPSTNVNSATITIITQEISKISSLVNGPLPIMSGSNTSNTPHGQATILRGLDSKLVPAGGVPLNQPLPKSPANYTRSEIYVDRSHSTAYSMNSTTGSIEVTDVKSGKVLETIKLGDDPTEVYASDDGEFLHVLNLLDNTLTTYSTKNHKQVSQGKLKRSMLPNSLTTPLV